MTAAFYKSVLKVTQKIINSVLVFSSLGSDLEMYVGSYQTKLVVSYFRKRTPPKMFNRVLNTLLHFLDFLHSCQLDSHRKQASEARLILHLKKSVLCSYFFLKFLQNFLGKLFLQNLLQNLLQNYEDWYKLLRYLSHLFEKCKISRIHEKSLNCFDSITGPIHYFIIDNSLEPIYWKLALNHIEAVFGTCF